MADFLLYHRITKDTGIMLAEELGIPHGLEPPQGRLRTLIRWGNGAPIRYNPEMTVNLKSAIETAVNKQRCSEIFGSMNIRTPERTNTVPCIARNSYHTDGQGLWFCWLPEQLEEVRREGAEYYIRYVPVKQEWRIHVIDGEVAFVQPKYSRPRTTTAFGGVGGFRGGWYMTHHNANEAPTNVCVMAVRGTLALGLQFGGADVIEGLDGKCYLLEVNTGPALQSPEARQPYVEYFRGFLR